MKSLKQQIADKCLYFNGLMNKSCEKGIQYDSVKEPDERQFKIPCIKTGGFCDVCKFPSEKIVNEIVIGIMEEGKKTMMGYSLIQKYIKKTGQVSGKIECPSCKGELHYNQSSINGHIWAKCKCGLGWME
jgi:hypothetical protein